MRPNGSVSKNYGKRSFTSMIECGFAASILLFVISSIAINVEAVTVVKQHPDDEYVLEHEVLYEDAIEQAKKLQIYPGPIPGCKPCTNSEMIYCKDGSVINDHCCCDGGFYKVFPFVEHTCRVGPEECKVQAGDCAEYSRLRECCCHSYLASVWKYLATGKGSRIHTNFTLFLTTFTVLLSLLLLPT